VLVKQGQRIIGSCDYKNDTGTTLGFGESATRNEMCIFSGTFCGGDGSGIVPLVP